MNDTAPHAPMAEQALIGSVLLGGRSAFEFVADIRPEHFFIARHQEIWRAIGAVAGESPRDTIDMIAVSERLSAFGKLDLVGGLPYLSQTTLPVQNWADVEVYGKLVTDAARRRAYLMLAEQIREIAADPAITPADVESRVEIAFTDVLVNSGTSDLGLHHVRQVVAEHFNRVESAIADPNPRELLGLPSGVGDIIRITRGYQPGRVYTWAGRPGMGKTSALTSELAYLCSPATWAKYGMEQPPVILLVTLEQTAIEIVGDMLTMGIAMPNVSRDVIDMGAEDSKRSSQRSGAPKWWAQYVKQSGALAQAELLIWDGDVMKPSQLRKLAVRVRAAYGRLDAIFIDYTQLMSGDEEENSRSEELEKIMRAAKALAKRIKCPMLMAAQLNRDTDKRSDKRPILTDLRESGGIENNSDVVFLLYREGYYKEMPPDEVQPLEIIVAKNRWGLTGTVFAAFHPRQKWMTDKANRLRG